MIEIQRYLENIDIRRKDRYTHNDNEEEDLFYREISIFESKIKYETGNAFIDGIYIGNEGNSIEELAIGASVNIGSSIINDDFLGRLLNKGGRGSKENDLINLYKSGKIKLEDLKNSSKTYIENLIK